MPVPIAINDCGRDLVSLTFATAVVMNSIAPAVCLVKVTRACPVDVNVELTVRASATIPLPVANRIFCGARAIEATAVAVVVNTADCRTAVVNDATPVLATEKICDGTLRSEVTPVATTLNVLKIVDVIESEASPVAVTRSVLIGALISDVELVAVARNVLIVT